MVFYKMTDEPNQEFIIDYNDVKIQIGLRYIPVGKRWVASIVNVVQGVRVVLGVPIFDQYGFENLFFIKLSEDRELFEDIAGTYIVVTTPEETEVITNPLVQANAMGATVV
jgi:hypothetical protein